MGGASVSCVRGIFPLQHPHPTHLATSFLIPFYKISVFLCRDPLPILLHLFPVTWFSGCFCSQRRFFLSVLST